MTDMNRMFEFAEITTKMAVLSVEIEAMKAQNQIDEYEGVHPEFNYGDFDRVTGLMEKELGNLKALKED